MVGDEDPGLRLGHAAEAVADERHLLVADPPVLEGQRARRVDAEHGEPLALEPGAEIVVDMAPIAAQRTREALQDVVERHVVIAGDAQRRQPGRLEPVEEGAGLVEIVDRAPAG